MSECDKLAAAIEERDIARADLEKVVGYNTKLQRERDKALAEVEQLKQALRDAWLENSGQAALYERTVNQSFTVRPEPSRLEIAAMAMQGFIGSDSYLTDIPMWSLKYADALIAAAKEEK